LLGIVLDAVTTFHLRRVFVTMKIALVSYWSTLHYFPLQGMFRV